MLRTILHPLRRIFFGKLNSLNVSLRARFLYPAMIAVAKGVVIEPHAHLDGYTQERISYGIEIGKNTTIRRYAYIIARRGFVRLGHDVSVNPFCWLSGSGGLQIGNNVRIAAHVSIVAAQHVYEDTKTPIRLQGLRTQGISIGNDVWIGSGARILDGVVIGDGCVIGANAVVTQSIPAYSVAVGIPAKVMKKR